MRPQCELLLAALILAAPLPAAAQVSVDLNALSPLGGAGSLPAPPPAATAPAHAQHRRHFYHHLAKARQEPPHAEGLASAGGGTAATPQASASPETIQHPGNLGPSFTSLPSLPSAVPSLPPPVPTLPTSVAARKPAPAKPAPASPPAAVAQSAPPASPAAAPALALPGSAPPPPPKPAASRLAETTPAPAAARPPTSASAPVAAPTPAETLPQGADRLTLPFFTQQSDLPPAENAMLRDFAQRYGAHAQYVIHAFASAPAGDDDPSTPRRISLARAQSVAAALTASGVPPGLVRLLALGNPGGPAPDRVDVIAMPPTGGHASSSSTH